MAETPQESVWSQEGVVCPYCAHMHLDDLYELSEDDNEMECESCGADFTVTLYISHSYTSRPATPPTAAPPEKP